MKRHVYVACFLEVTVSGAGQQMYGVIGWKRTTCEGELKPMRYINNAIANGMTA